MDRVWLVENVSDRYDAYLLGVFASQDEAIQFCRDMLTGANVAWHGREKFPPCTDPGDELQITEQSILRRGDGRA